MAQPAAEAEGPRRDRGGRGFPDRGEGRGPGNLPGASAPGAGEEPRDPGPRRGFDRLTKRPNQLIAKRTKQGQVLLGTREEKKRKKGRFQVERKEGRVAAASTVHSVAGPVDNP